MRVAVVMVELVARVLGGPRPPPVAVVLSLEDENAPVAARTPAATPSTRTTPATAASAIRPVRRFGDGGGWGVGRWGVGRWALGLGAGGGGGGGAGGAGGVATVGAAGASGGAAWPTATMRSGASGCRPSTAASAARPR